jgi:hypothetical protein
LALVLALAAPASSSSAAVRLHPGDILVAGITNGGNGAVFRVDPDSGRQKIVSNVIEGRGGNDVLCGGAGRDNEM